MTSDFWSAFYLKPRPLPEWPCWVRSSIGVAVVSITVVLLLAIFWVLMLLAFEATFSPSQEASRKFLLGAVGVFGAPFLVWRTWVMQLQARAANEQARIALEAHFTGVFAKSIELLGQLRDISGAESRSEPNIEARLGALYSLERLMNESVKDQKPILETLCAYVRENAPFTIDEREKKENTPIWRIRRKKLPPRRVDVQAALTIIGRRNGVIVERGKQEGWRLDFSQSDLAQYVFEGGNFDTSDFGGSSLEEAIFRQSSFCGGRFAQTNCQLLAVLSCDLTKSTYYNCEFKGAIMDQTNMSHARFVHADLRGASVRELNLESANLAEAFGSMLDMTVERVLSGGAYAHEFSEIQSLFQLFNNAICNEKTTVSGPVLAALKQMNPQDIDQAESEKREEEG
jgi:uncharacterized protein YjbI with pentapeptide repeats